MQKKNLVTLPSSYHNYYGYLWWMKDYGYLFGYVDQTLMSFKARGTGGQEIYVFPALDMVVVFTGMNFPSLPPNERIVYKYILPSAGIGQ